MRFFNILILILTVSFIQQSAWAAQVQSLYESFETKKIDFEPNKPNQIDKLLTDHKALSLADLRRIKFSDEAVPFPKDVASFTLWNGDFFQGTLISLNGETVKIKTEEFGEIAVNVYAIKFYSKKTTAEDIAKFVQVKEFKEDTKQDIVYSENKVPVKGMLKSIDEKEVIVEVPEIKDNETGKDMEVHLNITAVSAIRFTQVGKVTKKMGISITANFKDTTQVRGTPLSLNATELKLKTQFGEVTIPTAKLKYIEILGGNGVFLSDLEPTQSIQKCKLIDLVFPYKKDQNVMGDGPIAIGEQTWEKGLGVHSYCSITYNLNGAYKEFRAIIGMDKTATNVLVVPPAVSFQVLKDGETALGKDGIVKTAIDAAQEISVNVAGVKTLTLIVDIAGEQFEVRGRANWADAFLIKK